MYKMNCPWELVEFIIEYVTNPKRYIEPNNLTSNIFNIEKGVSQDSCLTWPDVLSQDESLSINSPMNKSLQNIWMQANCRERIVADKQSQKNGRMGKMLKKNVAISFRTKTEVLVNLSS
jgi:hypothetical protein